MLNRGVARWPIAVMPFVPARRARRHLRELSIVSPPKVTLLRMRREANCGRRHRVLPEKHFGAVQCAHRSKCIRLFRHA